MAKTSDAYKWILGGVTDIATLAERMKINEAGARALVERLQSEGFVQIREVIELMPRSVTEKKMIEEPFPDVEIGGPE